MSARYAFIEAQPAYGFPNNRHEVTLRGLTRFAENWSLFGSGTYNLETQMMTRDAAGFAYSDECFTYAMTMSQTYSTTDSQTDQTFGFSVSFRTLGDFGSTSKELFPDQ